MTGKAVPAGTSTKLTPMLAQYLEIKAAHPGALLLFRMGDFFETFFDDAKILAEVCSVTLTTRDRNSDHPVPLAGVPHHALDVYLSRLLAAGLTVAICEQTEDPAKAKGLVKREVVEVISPGTATAPELLPGSGGMVCLAYHRGAAGESGWATLDASTGEFRCGQEDVTLPSLCERCAAREVIVAETVEAEEFRRWRAGLPETVLSAVSAAWFHPALAADTLRDHFGVRDLDAFGLSDERTSLAVSAAGALLRYLTSLNLKRPVQVVSLQFAARGDRMLLDEETLRNLEVFRTLRGERGEGTLVHHLDRTVTPAGRRLLERRLAEPLTDLAALADWHRGVAGALDDRDWREDVRRRLRGVGDLDRGAVRAAAGRIGPAALRQLGESLRAAGEALAAISDGGHAAHPAVAWVRGAPDLSPVADRLLGTLAEQPPATMKPGEVVRPGVSPELDAAAAVASDTRGFLAALQTRERERSGIPTLKIGYNRVFGYYYEVSNKHLDRVPPEFSQKQTLVNAARFRTDELSAAEQTILDAEERMARLEGEIFAALLADVSTALEPIRALSARTAEIDLLFAFAELAERHRYVRPVCDDSLVLDIAEGRHPVVEQLLDGDFIPNDALLDGDTRQVLLLTGPNMGGKSTYLRQVALLVLMAQAGGFVPAARARIGVADRIFTRVGAGDNVARGQSTFYAEMSETARILHQMSRRSLVVLDEVGRGTSTYDGLSLAWAITEFLHHHDGPRPRTIFATHYHELTGLEQTLPRLVNLRLEVREWQGSIIFLHTVKPGCSDKSYGIHVARLAGVPEPVLRRAEELLALFSSEDARALAPDRLPGTPGFSLAADSPPAASRQLSLFSDGERDALDALRDLDLEGISPMDAFLWLARIKKQL
ncbi:MAG: DNA mismatch repair protein MutS [Gemmatimonas sp.]|nr:DNA mismatch repair protein MutS [Gemmatimonas sp.]